MPLLSSDRPLLEAFRQGGVNALTKVYKEYAPLIAGLLSRGFTFESKGRTLRFSGYQQPYDLENALQETFVRAFSQPARLAYDGLTPYRSYLSAIARNLVISDLRRREVAMTQLVREAEPDANALEDVWQAGPALSATPEPGGEAELIHQELIKLYESFVEQLEPVPQVFFRARFEEKLTQVEAGKRAGLSHMQARTLEYKLRRSLLKFMQSRGYLEGYRIGSVVSAVVLILS